jgi:hypothetical protein
MQGKHYALGAIAVRWGQAISRTAAITRNATRFQRPTGKTCAWNSFGNLTELLNGESSAVNCDHAGAWWRSKTLRKGRHRNARIEDWNTSRIGGET